MGVVGAAWGVVIPLIDLTRGRCLAASLSVEGLGGMDACRRPEISAPRPSQGLTGGWECPTGQLVPPLPCPPADRTDAGLGAAEDLLAATEA